MEIPKLYKYRSFIRDRINTPSGEQKPKWQHELFDGMISPAPPTVFNDPYDCDLVIEGSFLHEKAARELYIETVEQWKALTEQEKQLLRTTEDWKTALESILQMSLSDSLATNLMNCINNSFQELKRDFRVACFSQVKDSILMWSHYAENHTGFCIEYDFSHSPLKQHLHPVQYTKERKFIPGTFANSDGAMANHIIYEAALHKFEGWKYEEEWRCVFHRHNLNPFPFDISRYYFDVHNYITAVYLGAKASEKDCEKICAHYRGTDVKVFKMELQPDYYRLMPEEIGNST